MTKRVVVCCDGTWSTPDDRRDGRPAPTNVARLADGISCTDDQVLFYEPGVGTTPDEHLLGGAFGLGLSRNIRNAYAWLADAYRPGDELFLFGFSRGAYTARSLAGLIRNCGILKPDCADRVDQAFAFYRDASSRTHPTSLASEIFRKTYSQPSDDIHFIGVWDTVGALGIPDGVLGWKEISQLTPLWHRLWGFHDTQLSSHVRYAYHALAIDERRPPFEPTLWTGTATPGQTVEQVWFAGAHTDIGGGSCGSALSDITLMWMVQRARAAGLTVEPGRLRLGDVDTVGNRIAPDYAGPVEDSSAGLWGAFRPYHRLLHVGIDPAPPVPGQAIASSVVSRFEDPNCAYHPRGIEPYIERAPRIDVVDRFPAAAAPAAAPAPV